MAGGEEGRLLAWQYASGDGLDADPGDHFDRPGAGRNATWDEYRYSPTAEDPNRLKVLVIGEQFKWNVIYPGPKGKIGRYLLYPKPTDLAWPIVPPNKAGTIQFPNVPGPAYLPETQAQVRTSTNIMRMSIHLAAIIPIPIPIRCCRPIASGWMKCIAVMAGTNWMRRMPPSFNGSSNSKR